MRQPKKISDTELDVLKALWDLDGGTVRDILNHPVANGRNWAYTTVQTLLARLTAKRVVRREKQGRAYHFLPVISRNELIAVRLDELADRVCDGELTPLLLSLLHSRKFRAPDLVRLRGMIDQIDRG